jgi:hypothetical protein
MRSGKGSSICRGLGLAALLALIAKVDSECCDDEEGDK